MTTEITGRTPRGIRNNNPGNLRRNSDPWQGLAERQGDVEFFHLQRRDLWHPRAGADADRLSGQTWPAHHPADR
jgi:hypothetical protein